MLHPLIRIVNNRSLLKSLSSKYGTPLYIYDKKQLIDNITSIHDALLKSFDSFHICYTIKANSNPNIIKILKSTIPQLGADCSSPGELYAAEISGISPKNCIFTGNYESEDDLKIAFEKEAHINLDDITSFIRLKRIGIPKEISFRLNPGFGKGAFSQIITGGKNSKFGIPKEHILDAYKLAKESGVKEFGIQCMTGSGVLEPEYFPKLMKEILKTVKYLMDELHIDFRHISLGGGYGIPYKDDESSLNLNKVFNDISEVFHLFFDGKSDTPEIWIEPGRFVVGNAGILLSKVTGIKRSYKNFIGIDAGMETLIRPALYDAYHRIYKVGQSNDQPVQKVDFTGRICENTDRIATDRPFTKIDEGDLITVMDVGAYGFTMSNQFCGRPKPAEVLLDNKKITLIRKRESIEDLFSNCETD